jgi:N-acyl homoserine lactone hydrolase
MTRTTRSILAAAALLPSIIAFAPSTSAPPALKLYVFDCGLMQVNNDSTFHPHNPPGVHRTLSDDCFLVVHPTKGTLIWDTGLPESTPDGTVLANNFTLHIPHKLSEQLRAIGYDPATITYIALSHFHSDHAGNVALFPKATLLIQRPEYDAAFGPTPQKFGFDPSTYASLKSNPVKQLDGDYDVFGDGSVIIKRAPGHTPGHQTLFLRLPKTGNVLLSGDLAHFTDNWTNQRVPLYNFDSAQSVASMRATAQFLKDNHATLWIQHDHDQFLTLKHSPQYYE